MFKKTIRREKAAFFGNSNNTDRLIKGISKNATWLQSVVFFEIGYHELTKLAQAMNNNTNLISIDLPIINKELFGDNLQSAQHLYRTIKHCVEDNYCIYMRERTLNERQWQYSSFRE